MNTVSLIGNLATDVTHRTTTDGKSVSTFNVAVNRAGEGADFFRVVTFNKVAETCNSYLQKGNKVGVTGRLNANQWTTDEGEKKTQVEIVASNVDFLTPKQQEAQVLPQSELTTEDDIPF